jgi:hypothetical protein
MQNPWIGEYVALQRSDFELPVTPEKRVRVAAAFATLIRDAEMFGSAVFGSPNAETIRALLTMSEAEWEMDVAPMAWDLGAPKNFDAVSPRTRFTQSQDLFAHRSRKR